LRENSARNKLRLPIQNEKSRIRKLVLAASWFQFPSLERPRRLSGRLVLQRRWQALKQTAWHVANVWCKMERSKDSPRPTADLTLTMIVEIPSPNCANACRSGHSPGLCGSSNGADAALWRANLEPFSSLPLVLVSVTGTAFFDFLHGQTGVAADGIELHLVLRIQFLE